MSTASNIVYLKRKDIDVARWDACIDNAENGLIYAYSYYLDAMCDNWDALVLNDYEAVMPLPWRRKWGAKYVYQPAFIQRLGVFGNNLQSINILLFYKKASKHFHFLHYNVSQYPSERNTPIPKKNFIIHLNQTLDHIRLGYSNECLRNIQKAINRGCTITREIQIEHVISLYQQAYGKMNHLVADDYKRLVQFKEVLKMKEQMQILGVHDEKGEIIYGAAILQDEKRLYYIIGAPTNKGRQKRATYFFIDQVLKSHAGQNRIFDFEGSEIPNVSNFYQKFGPQTEYYYEIKLSRFPFLLL